METLDVDQIDHRNKEILMSIRRLMNMAAGLALATGAGLTNSLQAQNPAADFRADAAFVNQVAATNLMEVRLGQLAGTKAQTPAVKQFAAKMVNDHTWMQEQWIARANRLGGPFSARYTPEQQADVTRLSKLSGAEFERAYMDLMVQDHQKNLAAFQTQGRAARSADARELVERGIPALQEHYNLATQIRAQVSGDVAAANNPNAQQQPGAQPTTPWGNVKPEVKPAPGSQQPAQQPAQQPGQPAPQNQPAQANQGNPQDAQVTAQARADAKADAEFIRDIAADHTLELRLAEVAVRRAQHPQVKQFAEKILNDHRSMQERWLAMANRNGLALQPGYGKLHRAKLTKLEKRSGASFDREYMTLEVRNHKDYLDYFNREGQAARSADVRELVDRDTPALTEHFNLAKRIGAQVNADTNVELRATSLLR